MGDYGLNIHSLITIDDKGRILLPIKLRELLDGCVLTLTRGIEECLWLFPSDEWEKFAQTASQGLSIFNPDSRMIQRRILAPAQEVPLDAAGRIKLNPSLMQMARLQKDCYLIGLGYYLEIWDSQLYHAYETATNDRLESAFARTGDKAHDS
ncbi:MAG: division/cell wall cluster transcriptional repressor MraZ [Spirochaetia bacterium]